MARAHLNTWVAAATVIQRGFRAWLLRRRLEEVLQQHRAAATVLQSAWRGRYFRLQQQQRLQACVVLQVSTVRPSLHIHLSCAFGGPHLQHITYNVNSRGGPLVCDASFAGCCEPVYIDCSFNTNFGPLPCLDCSVAGVFCLLVASSVNWRLPI